jgi:hypothetical protein
MSYRAFVMLAAFGVITSVLACATAATVTLVLGYHPSQPPGEDGEAVGEFGFECAVGRGGVCAGAADARTPHRFRSSRNRLRAGGYRPLIFVTVAGQRVAPMCAEREGGATPPQSRKPV